MSRALQAATTVRPNESQATLLSGLFVFLLMTAYFMLRSARDSLSSDWTDAQLSLLWTSTFFLSLIGVALYGAIISKLRFRSVVPGVYAFFAATFVAFYALAMTVGENDAVNRAYYVWISVFSLFHLSVFWSFMSGIYNKGQAKRLFALIAMGASIGAIVGPSIALLLADDIGTINLLLIASVMLLMTIPLVRRLEALSAGPLGNEGLQADLSEQQRLGRNPLSGFSAFARNPYLLAIGLFILLYVLMNTFIYYELRKPLGDFDRDTRTQIWAGIDLAVNSLALLTAFFATSRLVTRFGMPATLALIPALMVGGWAIVALSPVLAVLIGLQIARRAGNYAVTRPGREMLFTIVDADTRYKAKPVIDIVVYRGGDVATAWLYTALTTVVGLGLAGIAVFAAGVAAVWAMAGIFLGRRFESGGETGSADAASGED